MLLNLISRITLLTLILISNVVETKDILVSTTSGMVRGITINSKNGKAVDSYLGIPYAEPPLKKLRFARPVSVKPWSGVFNATKLPSSCPQRLVPIAKFHPHLRKQIPTTSFDEDCLKLNFWVPVGTTPTSKLPVLVYIHGGGFSYGGTTTTTNLGDVLSSEENVIVASMNYRLSSLGFVYLNHSEASGNAGIYDQKLALEWIAANAEFFGGDSKNLVLIGESAGATSVLFHRFRRSPTITSKDFTSVVKFLFEDKTELERRMIEMVYESMMTNDNATTVVEATELLFGDSQFTCPVYEFVESLNTTKL